MEYQPLDLSSRTKAFKRRKGLSRDTNDQPLNLSSSTKDYFLSAEKRQNPSNDEKLERKEETTERISSPVRKDESANGPKSLTFDQSCHRIPDSKPTSLKEYIKRTLEEKIIADNRSSASPVGKRHKTSSRSSIKMLQDDLKIATHSNSDEMTSRSYMERGLLTPSSSEMPRNEQKTTLYAYCDEKKKRDFKSTEYSLSASENRGSASIQEPFIDSNQKLPYECFYCSKNFTQPLSLVYHFRIHGKPFICNCCEKIYRQTPDFIKHIEKHAGEGGTPFVCHKCNKAFSRKVNLDKHVKTHLNDPNKADSEKNVKIQESGLNTIISEKCKKIRGNNPDKLNSEKHMIAHDMSIKLKKE